MHGRYRRAGTAYDDEDAVGNNMAHRYDKPKQDTHRHLTSPDPHEDIRKVSGREYYFEADDQNSSTPYRIEGSRDVSNTDLLGTNEMEVSNHGEQGHLSRSPAGIFQNYDTQDL